jgi:hypothetical protein
VRAAATRSFSDPMQTIDVPDLRPLADDEALIEVRAAGAPTGTSSLVAGNGTSESVLRRRSASPALASWSRRWWAGARQAVLTIGCG